METKENPKDPLSEYFEDSVSLLQSSLRYFHTGEKIFYRVAALQLRLLLCDTVRRHDRMIDISLLPKVHPGFEILPVSSEALPLQGKPLTLPIWLNQPISGTGDTQISIRDFIRRVCDQDGGAHADPKPQAGLSAFPHRAEVIMRLAERICEAIHNLSFQSG
jgi:hypothetical protein